MSNCACTLWDIMLCLCLSSSLMYHLEYIPLRPQWKYGCSLPLRLWCSFVRAWGKRPLALFHWTQGWCSHDEFCWIISSILNYLSHGSFLPPWPSVPFYFHSALCLVIWPDFVSGAPSRWKRAAPSWYSVLSRFCLILEFLFSNGLFA